MRIDIPVRTLGLILITIMLFGCATSPMRLNEFERNLSKTIDQYMTDDILVAKENLKLSYKLTIDEVDTGIKYQLESALNMFKKETNLKIKLLEKNRTSNTLNYVFIEEETSTILNINYTFQNNLMKTIRLQLIGDKVMHRISMVDDMLNRKHQTSLIRIIAICLNKIGCSIKTIGPNYLYIHDNDIDMYINISPSSILFGIINNHDY